MDFIILQTAKMLMFYHDPARLKIWRKKTHSSPSFCNPLLLLTEAIRFMRRLVICASEEAVGFALGCWAWSLAVVWGISALPSNGGFDSPLARPRPRDCQTLPLLVPRWTSLLFMPIVLDISVFVHEPCRCQEVEVKTHICLSLSSVLMLWLVSLWYPRRLLSYASYWITCYTL